VSEEQIEHQRAALVGLPGRVLELGREDGPDGQDRELSPRAAAEGPRDPDRVEPSPGHGAGDPIPGTHLPVAGRVDFHDGTRRETHPAIMLLEKIATSYELRSRTRWLPLVAGILWRSGDASQGGWLMTPFLMVSDVAEMLGCST
jgi:hypothetical protein